MADGSGPQYSSSDSREDSNSQDASKLQTANIFRNDGSFMEMFKKLQEDQKKKEEPKESGVGEAPTAPGPEDDGGQEPSAKDQPKKTSLSFVRPGYHSIHYACIITPYVTRASITAKPTHIMFCHCRINFCYFRLDLICFSGVSQALG